jgi:predicted RNase H-like nuclease (RuvC/YqgF family)
LAENLDIKLTKLREDFDQSVSSLVKEVSELKSNLGGKQAKIRALESELATFKGNYKSAIENTKGKLESCEIEQNRHAENLKIHDCNIQKLFKDLDKYRKETKATGKKQSISKGH